MATIPYDAIPYDAIPYETRLRDIQANVVDIADFNDRVVGAYNSGLAERGLPADDQAARSVIPAGTGALRDFSYIAPDIPEFNGPNCVGCMDCVTQCPDTAILAKVAVPATLEERLASIADESERQSMSAQWTVTNKYFTVPERKGVGGGKFGIFIDPTKCKGCAECVDACGDHDALKMIRKTTQNVQWYRTAWDVYKSMPETPAKFINEKALSDMMLTERSLLYVGGAGSCMGCGEATALRMMLAATGFLYGQENIGIVAATGCNTVYTSTYPYNPYKVSWTNSLFENAPADAMGVRALGSARMEGQAALDHRRRRRHERYRLPVAVAHDGGGRGHQGAGPRYAGLFQHRRPGFHQFVQGPGRQDELPRHRHCGQEGKPQGARQHLHDAQGCLRRPDHLRSHEPFLQSRDGSQSVPGAGDYQCVHHLPARTRRGRQHG